MSGVDRPVAGELERAFRLALLLVVVVSGTFRLLAARRVGPALGSVELLYLGLAVVVLTVVAVGTSRRRPTDGRVLVVLAALALGLDVVQAVHLTLGGAGRDVVGGTRDWTLANVGWLCFFTLGTVRRRWWLVAALLTPFVVRAGLLVALGDLERLRPVGSLGVALVVLQLGGALFLAALRDQAQLAEVARDERVRLDADRAVAEALQADFRARTQALADTTMPLLRELADGTASPADERTRHRARIESARLRRLFAEADSVDGSIAGEVRSVVEQVERGGVSAALECEPTPPVPAAARRALLDGPMAALALARTRARVVVQVVGGEVVVSVTTDGPPPPVLQRAPVPGVRTLQESVDGRTWTESAWTVASPPPADRGRTAASLGARPVGRPGAWSR